PRHITPIPTESHLFFFCPHPPTSQIYALSLHDALPISISRLRRTLRSFCSISRETVRLNNLRSSTIPSKSPRHLWSPAPRLHAPDRKSTRLNSSHVAISYAVFCLKKKTDHGLHAIEGRS